MTPPSRAPDSAATPIASRSSTATAPRKRSRWPPSSTSPTPSSTAWSGSRVNAKEQLRRYLEQRREAGELELVLDQLSIDEVMRIVGATSTGAAAAASTSRA